MTSNYFGKLNELAAQSGQTVDSETWQLQPKLGEATGEWVVATEFCGYRASAQSSSKMAAKQEAAKDVLTHLPVIELRDENIERAENASGQRIYRMRVIDRYGEEMVSNWNVGKPAIRRELWDRILKKFQGLPHGENPAEIVTGRLSPKLSDIQRQTIPDWHDFYGPPISCWINHLLDSDSKDGHLLISAFVAPSFFQTAQDFDDLAGLVAQRNYQKLETLGDSVVNAAVTMMGYDDPDSTPKTITEMKTDYACNANLSKIFCTLGLEKAMLLGPNQVPSTDMKADMFEALIGYMWLQHPKKRNKLLKWLGTALKLDRALDMIV